MTTDPFPATNWVQEAYLKASDPDPNDWFGYSVAMDEVGKTVVIGANQEDGNYAGVDGAQGNVGGASPLTFDRGAAYVFARTPGTTNWAQAAYLKPFAFNTNTAGLDYFGWSTAISGDSILVGAYNTARDAVYVFARQQRCVDDAPARDELRPATVSFGYAVALEGSVAAISAVRESTLATRVGAAFVYAGFAPASPPLPNPTIVYQHSGPAVDLDFPRRARPPIFGAAQTGLEPHQLDDAPGANHRAGRQGDIHRQQSAALQRLLPHPAAVRFWLRFLW